MTRYTIYVCSECKWGSSDAGAAHDHFADTGHTVREYPRDVPEAGEWPNE